MSTSSGKSTKKAAASPTGVIDVRETVKIAAILTAICLVIALALAATNMLTKDVIAEAAAAAKAATCYEAIPAEEYVHISECSEYRDNYADLDVYLALDDGIVTGAAITTSSRGYGSAVEVMTGIDQNGCVSGVSVLEHDETVGLGANAAKSPFLDQFKTGEEEQRPSGFAVSRDGGEIDAVTSATVTSRAVTRAVNEALEIFARIEADGIIGARLHESAASGTDTALSPTDTPATEGGEDIG